MTFIKKVVNSDPGDSDHVGGDDWDKLDNYFDDVDITGPAKINTNTEIRSAKLKIKDSDNSHAYIITSGDLSADRTLNLPVLTGTDTLDTLGLAQTFTAAKTFNDQTIKLRNPGNTFSYTLVHGAIAADRTLNVPVLTGTDTLATLGLAQTFTAGQTFNDNVLKVRNPADTFSYTIRSSAIAANRDLTLPLTTGTDTLATLGLAQTFTGAQTVNAKLDAQQDIVFTGDISPTNITSDQNDYAPTGNATASTFKITGDSSFRKISGIAGGADGRILTLQNVGDNTILLTDSDTGSTAANRFDFALSNDFYDFPLFGGCAITLRYDATDTRWRPIHNSGPVIPTLTQGYYLNNDLVESNSGGTGYTDYTFFHVAASGGTFQPLAPLAKHPGIGQMTLGTSTTGSASMRTPGTGFLFGGSCYWRYDAVFKIDSLSNATDRYTLRVGFIDSATAESTDGAFIRYVDNVNSGNWVVVTRSNSSESTSNSSSAAQTSTYTRATIIVNPAANIMRAYIDGTQIGSDITTNIPTGAGRNFGAGIMFLKSAGTTNNNALTIDMQQLISYNPTYRVA